MKSYNFLKKLRGKLIGSSAILARFDDEQIQFSQNGLRVQELSDFKGLAKRLPLLGKILELAKFSS